ncbi:uncharacterized protein V6R79_012277 [Siganus canaliculatus]
MCAHGPHVCSVFLQFSALHSTVSKPSRKKHEAKLCVFVLLPNRNHRRKKELIQKADESRVRFCRQASRA